MGIELGALLTSAPDEMPLNFACKRRPNDSTEPRRRPMRKQFRTNQWGCAVDYMTESGEILATNYIWLVERHRPSLRARLSSRLNWRFSNQHRRLQHWVSPRGRDFTKRRISARELARSIVALAARLGNKWQQVVKFEATSPFGQIAERRQWRTSRRRAPRVRPTPIAQFRGGAG